MAAYDGANTQVFGGGGFMPSQGQQGNMGGSPGAKAVSASVDETYAVDGVELGNITMVGKIVSVAFTDQLARLEVNDSTGTAKVEKYVGDEEQSEAAEWGVGVYVRIHGKISDFDNKKRVQAFQIQPVTDFNEVTYHLLKCIFQHAHLTKGGAGGAGGAAARPARSGAPRLAAPPRTISCAVHAPAAGFAGGADASRGGGGGAAEVGDDGFTGVQRDVAAVFKRPDAAAGTGMHNDQVVAALAGKHGRPQVMAAIDFLKDQGHLFTTIDDDHCQWCS